VLWVHDLCPCANPLRRYSDLKELGTEAAVKAAGKCRQQGKEYVVQDGAYATRAGAGYGCNWEMGVQLGYGAQMGDGVPLCNGVQWGYGVRLGNGVATGEWSAAALARAMGQHCRMAHAVPLGGICRQGACAVSLQPSRDGARPSLQSSYPNLLGHVLGCTSAVFQPSLDGGQIDADVGGSKLCGIEGAMWPIRARAARVCVAAT